MSSPTAPRSASRSWRSGSSTSTGRCSRPGHAYAAVVPAFIDALLRGTPVRIFGDGLQTRDFTYIGTVVRVLADAVLRKVTCPGPVNLAFGTRVPVIDLDPAARGHHRVTRRHPARGGEAGRRPPLPGLGRPAARTLPGCRPSAAGAGAGRDRALVPYPARVRGAGTCRVPHGGSGLTTDLRGAPATRRGSPQLCPARQRTTK